MFGGPSVAAASRAMADSAAASGQQALDLAMEPKREASPEAKTKSSDDSEVNMLREFSEMQTSVCPCKSLRVRNLSQHTAACVVVTLLPSWPVHSDAYTIGLMGGLGTSQREPSH